MKNMFKYAAAAVILSASLVSCELDNYDGPNAQIYGEVRDSKTGALIQQDINGTRSCTRNWDLRIPTASR